MPSLVSKLWPFGWRSAGMTVVIVAILIPAMLSAGERSKVFIASTVDGTNQPCYVILPEHFDPEGQPVPLLVSLHTWSGNVEQRIDMHKELEELADARGWLYLFPHFDLYSQLAGDFGNVIYSLS